MPQDVGQRPRVAVGDPTEQLEHVAVEPRQVAVDGVQRSDAIGVRSWLGAESDNPSGAAPSRERDADALADVDGRTVGNQVIEGVVQVRRRNVDDDAGVAGGVIGY
jgi:hypothetical protein